MAPFKNAFHKDGCSNSNGPMRTRFLKLAKRGALSLLAVLAGASALADCQDPKVTLLVPEWWNGALKWPCDSIGMKLWVRSEGCYHIDNIDWAMEGGNGSYVLEVTPDPVLPYSLGASLVPVTGGAAKCAPGTLKVTATVHAHCDVPAHGAAHWPAIKSNPIIAGVECPDSGGGCGSCGSGSGDGGGPSVHQPGVGSDRIRALGSGVVANKNGVSISLGLGPSDDRNDAGVLYVGGTTPSTDFGRPVMLTAPYAVDPATDRVIVTRNTAGVIQSVKPPKGWVQVADSNPNDTTYDLNMYYEEDVEYVASQYQPKSGRLPFATWRIENPSGDANQLRVAEYRSGNLEREFLYAFSSGNNQWTLTYPGTLGAVRTWTSTTGTTTEEGREVLQAGVTLSREVRTYAQVTYNDTKTRTALTQVVEGTGTSTRTTSYSLYALGDSDPRSGLTRRVDYPDGRWEMFEYDELGRLVAKYETFLDVAPPSGDALPDNGTCVLTEYWYESVSSADDISLAPALARLETRYVPAYASGAYAWVAVSRLGRCAILNEAASTTTLEERRYASASGSWSDEENVISSTEMFADVEGVGLAANRPRQIVNGDGTVRMFSYSMAGSNTLVTEDAGEPMTSGDSTLVKNGTRTITTFDAVGRALEEIKYPIVDGGVASIVLDHMVYTYSDSQGNLLDPSGRSFDLTDLANRKTEVRYSCCGVSYVIDPEGVKTYFDYDDLKRLIGTRRVVDVSGGERTLQAVRILDALGREVASLQYGTNSSTPIILSGISYDSLGRLTQSTNSNGGVTVISESVSSTTMKVTRTTTNPDTGQVVDVYYRDGRLERRTGSAAFPSLFTYGCDEDGRTYASERKLDASGNQTLEWTKRYYDALGRIVETRYSKGTSGYSSALQWYNSKNQPWKSRDPDGVVTLSQFDGLGRLEHLVVLVNSVVSRYANYTETTLPYETFDPSVHFSTKDRVTRIVYSVVPASSNPVLPDRNRVETYAWGESSAGVPQSAPRLISRVDSSTDGLRRWESKFADGAATPLVPVTTTTSREYDRPNRRRTETITRPAGDLSVDECQNGQKVSSQHKTGAGTVVTQTTFGYDAFGRLASVTDAANGTVAYTYNAAGQVLTQTDPCPSLGAPNPQRTFTYDSMGRLLVTSQPDGGATTNQYYSTGLLWKNSGVRTYPVAYEYDAQGRMTGLSTWTNYFNSLGSAKTTWGYDERGRLKYKDYADPATGLPPATADTTGASYTYTDGGKLKTRTWRRTVEGARIVTTYKYGFDDSEIENDHGDLVGIDYSDEDTVTPPVAFTYDRMGRRVTVTRGSTAPLPTTTFQFNDAGMELGESNSAGSLDGLTVVRTLDQYLRHLSESGARSAVVIQGQSYQYDAAGRLEYVTDALVSSRRVQYQHAGNSDQVAALTFTNGAGSGMLTAKSFDKLDRLLGITSVPFGSSPGAPTSFTYQYDAANQRRSGTGGDGSCWQYDYDCLGQVTSAKRYWNDGTPVAGQQFEYRFDDVGNRRRTKVGGDETGNNLRVADYTPDLQNRYSQRDIPNAVEVLGMANVGATVVVTNQGAAYRKGEYFRKEVPVSNGSASQFPNLAVHATWGSTNQAVTGGLFVAKTPEQFTYDLDGNLLQDGHWDYTWDAENRLRSMATRSGIVGPVARLEFEYDWMGRRVRKLVYDARSGGNLASDVRFLYDGWDLIAEVNGLTSSVLRTYLWGKDLSGTSPGLGGAGGLLVVKAASGTVCYVAYDGNANVAKLYDENNGSVAATYEYGPFGELLRATGPMAKANSFRFSSKYQDEETDMLYYGYRYYCASTGRWLSRDPIAERGGPNLYVVAANHPVDARDFLGMMTEGDLKAVVKTLDAVASTIKCCCNSRDHAVVDLTLTGLTPSGSTVTGKVSVQPRGCVDSYTVYWWDCYSAHDEAGFLNQAFLGANFKDYGWSRGGSFGGSPGEDSYSKVAAPGIWAWTGAGDPYHIAMKASVIYFYCGPDGFKHVRLRFGDEIQWAWDKQKEGWQGPVP